MKRLFLCLVIFGLPLMADEIWLGMAMGAEGDTLLLVDNLKVYVPGLSQGRYVGADNQAISAQSVTFPFTASLVRVNQEVMTGGDATSADKNAVVTTYVRTHKFYDVVDGRLVEK